MKILAEAEALPKTANIQTQLISLWMAPVFGAVLLIAFLAFPGFFPPMSPAMTAEQVAQFYRDNTTMIRFSMITFNLCGIMLLPLFMVIVIQMKRMATQSHVFAYCYLTAAVSGATLFALADIFYLVAAFAVLPRFTSKEPMNDPQPGRTVSRHDGAATRLRGPRQHSQSLSRPLASVPVLDRS